MLTFFRKFANTLLGKVVLGVLTLSMAGFGISGILTSLGSNTLATVDGSEITVRDFQRAYNDQINQAAQQIGKVPTSQEAMAMGIPGAVIQRLASDRAVSRFSTEIGLGVSQDRLALMVRQDPTFSGSLGSFDRATFARVLAQVGYTEAEYFNLQGDASRRQQLVSGLFAGTVFPQTALAILTRFTDDTRTVDYVVLNGESVTSVPTPTDEDLGAYLKDHQTEFRTKELRTVDLLVLTPESLASTQTVTEDQIAAEYERTKESRIKLEKRTIRQIALKTPELEKAFTDGKTAGTPLADLLTQNNVSFEDIGTLAKSEINDPTLADAAFSLAQDDYAIIPGIGGKRVITISAIQGGGQISLAEAHDEIAKQLATASARNAYSDILDQVEELRAAGKPLSEIGPRIGITPFTLAVDSTGSELVGVETLGESDRGRVASGIFDGEVGQVDPAVSMGSNRNAWYDLKKIEPARDQTLDEVKDAVSAAWTKAETDKALQAEVDQLLADLKAGKSFEEAVTAIGQISQVSQPIKRSGDGTPLFNAAVANEVFNGGPDHYGTAVNGDGDHVVFQVVDTTETTAAAPDAAKKYLEDSTRDTLYADFRSGITNDTDFKINQQLLSQVLSLDTAQ